MREGVKVKKKLCYSVNSLLLASVPPCDPWIPVLPCQPLIIKEVPHGENTLSQNIFHTLSKGILASFPLTCKGKMNIHLVTVGAMLK